MKKNLLVALAAVALCSSAHAYRPFDATDAAVNDPGMLELEIGAGRLHEGRSRILSIPAVVATYGVGGDTEVGVEARVNRVRDGLTSPYRARVEDAAINVKHVLRRGSLQDASGLSVAAECSLLLPQSGPSTDTVGAGCIGLFSQKWEPLTAHLNVGLERTPGRTTARTASLVGVGPEDWKVVPVTELRWAADNIGGWDRSVLAGAIIPQGKDLALDLAWRQGNSSDGPVRELRVGVTWTFSPGGTRTE